MLAVAPRATVAAAPADWPTRWKPPAAALAGFVHTDKMHAIRIMHEFRVYFSGYSFSEHVLLREPRLTTSHAGNRPSGAARQPLLRVQGMRSYEFREFYECSFSE